MLPVQHALRNEEEESDDIQIAVEQSLREQADREERNRQRQIQEEEQAAAVAEAEEARRRAEETAAAEVKAAEEKRQEDIREKHRQHQALVTLIRELNDAFGYGEPVSIPYELLSL